ncbi:DNA polymerase III subunit delta' [Nitrincola alkalilacustris]|uniref:DNA polymerase III subunit delta' n=1 Tax=Nitrincola alkalilacustris TaxID=1571224 RepID=UPI001F10DE44|nr:DNA polymerase III subunit delta' [Nitrincola alkalilacustris]
MMHQAEVLPWAWTQWQQVIKQHRSGRLPHALLLAGVAGTGKSAFAETLANLLLCHHPDESSPCGHCKSCQLLEGGNHPDLIHLSPEEPGKPIKVDQIRDLGQMLHSTAQQGGYRVVIMNPAEAMNIAAANALLKSLEEPGNDTLLLLVSDRPGQLMPTIRSRCQRIDIPLPDADTACEWLAAQLNGDQTRARQLLGITRGSPFKALSLAGGDLMPVRAELLKGLSDILKNRISPLLLAEKMLKQDTLLILDWLQSVLADIVRVQSAEEIALVNSDMSKMLFAVAKNTTAAKIFSMLDHIQAERFGLFQRHNLNRQLLLERLFFDWADLVR